MRKPPEQPSVRSAGLPGGPFPCRNSSSVQGGIEDADRARFEHAGTSARWMAREEVGLTGIHVLWLDASTKPKMVKRLG